MAVSLTRRTFTAGAAAAAALAPGLAQAQSGMEFKYGNAGNDQTISNKFNAKLAQVIEQRTNGAVKTKIFAGTLGGEKALIEGMSLGTIDIYNGAYTGTREFDIMYSPGFFRDGEHAKRVIRSAIGEKSSKVLEDRYKARLVGVGRLGPYCLAVKKPITSLAELKGMKIRTPQIEGCVEAVKHLGANPTPIAFNEVYLALQQGVVDGFVSALNPSVALKFYEPCKYILSNAFGEALDKQAISVRAWGRMSADQQKAMMTAFDEIEAVDYFKAGVDAISGDLAKWKQFNGPDSVITVDNAALLKTMESLNAKLANEVFGAGAWDAIQKA